MNTWTFLMDTPAGGKVTAIMGNLSGQLKVWLGLIAALVGVVMVIAAIIKIGKGLMSKGQGQVNWVQNILLLIVGLMLGFGGLVTSTGFFDKLGEATVDELNALMQDGGGGVIVIDVTDLGIETNFAA